MIWLLLFACTVTGQNDNSSVDTVYYDTTLNSSKTYYDGDVNNYGEEAVVAAEDEESSTDASRKFERRYMNETELSALRQKKEFQYEDIDSAKADIHRQEPTPSSFKRFDASFLLWFFAAIALCVIVLQFAGFNVRQVFTPRKMRSKTSNDAALENIHDIPYDTAIEDAVVAGNYSLAVRLMYLQSLKLLSDKALIKWQTNKTNWQYVHELKDTNLKRRFTNMTSIFEYVRYGSMPLSETQFNMVRQSFDAFNKQAI